MISKAVELADRIRAEIGDRPGIAEIRMFGGYCFMLNGNMLVASMKSGELLVRIPPGGETEALSRPGAGPMQMGTRTMSGFIGVTHEGIETDEALREWIAYAEAHVGRMPPK